MNRSDPSRSWVAILAVPTEILYSAERAAALGRVIDEGEELGPAPTRARVDSADRRHLRQEVAAAQQGRREPTRRRKS